MTERVTRILFGVVAVVAGPVGVIMLVAPTETDRYFSWPIGPPPVAATVGGFYIASAVVFGWAALRADWAEARPLCFGVLALTIPTLVATIHHEEVFDFGRWQALAWVGLFAAAPISYGSILLARRNEPATQGARLATWARILTGALGLLFVAYAVQIWREDVTEFPNTLIGLSGRFIGCWCAFLAALATYVVVRNEWSRPSLLALAVYPLGALAAALRSYEDLTQDGRAAYLIALLVLTVAGGSVLIAGREDVSASSPSP